MKQLGIVNFIAIILAGFIIVGFTVYNKNAAREFEELRLSYVIDFASDAAAFRMLQADDLGMDYTDFGKVKTRPDVALDTFLDVFCFNYGMYPTRNTKADVGTRYIPAFTVATYDGYYVATPQTISRGDVGEAKGLAFGPKMAYSYTDPNTGYLYALNLGTDQCLKIDSTSQSLVKTTTLPDELNTKPKRQAVINKVLTTGIGSAIDKVNQYESFWHNKFFLPANLTTQTGVNPVSGPSIMALVQNVDLTTGQKASAFSITGSRINNLRFIIGYIKSDGRKYYCYADKMPKIGDGTDNPKYKPLGMYKSKKDAAKAGYQYDAELMK